MVARCSACSFTMIEHSSVNNIAQRKVGCCKNTESREAFNTTELYLKIVLLRIWTLHRKELINSS